MSDPGELRRSTVIVRSSSGFVCNNACLFCAQGDLRTRAPRLPSFDALPTDLAGSTVAFVGGEPTLVDDLPAQLAMAIAGGARRVVVQTNGRRLAYPSYARALAASAGDRLWLEVSLQGSTKEMHDFHTNVVGSFGQTIAGLRNARAAGIRAGVGVVVTRSNYRHLADLVRVAHAVGVGVVRASLVVPVGAAARSPARGAPPAALLAAPVGAARNTAERLGIVWLGPGAAPDERFPFVGLGETEPPPKVASIEARRDHEGS